MRWLVRNKKQSQEWKSSLSACIAGSHPTHQVRMKVTNIGEVSIFHPSMHTSIYSFSHPPTAHSSTHHPPIFPSTLHLPTILPSLHPSIHFSIHPSILLSIHLYIHPPIHQPTIYQSIHCSTHLPTLSSTNPLIHTLSLSSIHPFVPTFIYSIFLLSVSQSTFHIPYFPTLSFPNALIHPHAPLQNGKQDAVPVLRELMPQ